MVTSTTPPPPFSTRVAHAREIATRMGWPTFDNEDATATQTAEVIREHFVSECARHATDAKAKVESDPEFKRPFWIAVRAWMNRRAKHLVSTFRDPSDWIDMHPRSPWSQMTTEAQREYPELTFAKGVLALVHRLG